MNKLKSHFRYTNGQRNGILFLILIIVLLQLFYFFILPYFSTNNKNVDVAELMAFQHKIDSLKKIALQNKTPKIFPFNPSFLSDYKGYQLGMSTEEIDRIIQHRAQGKYINSAKQFQEVTHISDSLLHTIKAYFKFPDWLIQRNQNKKLSTKQLGNYKISKTIKSGGINTVTAENLIVFQGIGDKLAKRIINYRNKLGGYSFNEQLYEVWGLKKEVADRILTYYTVLEKPSIDKLNINTASFKEILSIAYIDYELTKKIFNYRDEVSEIQSLDDLKKIDGFPVEKFDRIALYLVAQ